MNAYLDERGELTTAPADGWFDTGDLAQLTGDGTIHLRGRDSEVINVSGLKVVPCEVEEAIAALPGVVEVKVYAGAASLGKPDGQGGGRRRKRRCRWPTFGHIANSNSSITNVRRSSRWSTLCRGTRRARSSAINCPDALLRVRGRPSSFEREEKPYVGSPGANVARPSTALGRACFRCR